MKHAREDETLSCPVCMEALGEGGRRTRGRRAPSFGFPFDCGHPLCDTCDASMRSVDDRRCPVCRAPREGVSAADAEPSPTRNALPMELMDDVGFDIGDAFSVGMLTGAARALRRQRPSAHALRRARGSDRRSIFFPTQPPIDARRMQRGIAGPRGARAIEHAALQARLALLAAHEELSEDANLQGPFPTELLQQLLNVPQHPLTAWRRARAS